MHTDGIDRKRYAPPVARFNCLLSRHADRAWHDEIGIVDDRTHVLTGHERAVELIGAIRVSLAGRTQAGSLSSRHNLRSGQPHKDQRPVDHHGGSRDRLCKRRAANRHVEQRAMRLDVLQPHSLGSRDDRQCPDLICHEVFDVRWRKLELAATKTVGIWDESANGSS